MQALPFCTCQLHQLATNPQAVSFQGSMATRKLVAARMPEILARARELGMRLPENYPRLPKLLGTSMKVEKGLKKGVVTTVLYLSPSSESGFNLCPWASPECSAACLGHSSGQLSMRPSMNARLWKTALWKVDKDLFFQLLAEEVADFEAKVLKKKGRKKLIPAVRLDGSTDLHLADQLLRRYPNLFRKVRFYDYTKSHGRMSDFLSGKLDPRRHLTFSYSGHNLREATDVLARGGNVAVVFDARPAVKGKNEADPLPKTWQGYKAIDADETDIRFFDKPGTVAGLRFKTARKRKQALETAGVFVEDPRGARTKVRGKALPNPDVSVPCAWCGKPSGELGAEGSHGMCPACDKKLREEHGLPPRAPNPSLMILGNPSRDRRLSEEEQRAHDRRTRSGLTPVERGTLAAAVAYAKRRGKFGTAVGPAELHLTRGFPASVAATFRDLEAMGYLEYRGQHKSAGYLYAPTAAGKKAVATPMLTLSQKELLRRLHDAHPSEFLTSDERDILDLVSLVGIGLVGHATMFVAPRYRPSPDGWALTPLGVVVAGQQRAAEAQRKNPSPDVRRRQLERSAAHDPYEGHRTAGHLARVEGLTNADRFILMILGRSPGRLPKGPEAIRWLAGFYGIKTEDTVPTSLHKLNSMGLVVETYGGRYALTEAGQEVADAWEQDPGRPRWNNPSPDARRRQLERDSEAGDSGARAVLAAVKKREGALVECVVSVSSRQGSFSHPVRLATKSTPGRSLAHTLVKKHYFDGASSVGDRIEVSFGPGLTWAWEVKRKGRGRKLAEVAPRRSNPGPKPKLGSADYKAAAKAFKRFHGVEHSQVTVYDYDDGKPGLTERYVAMLGRVPETHYTSPIEGSNKEGPYWVHKHSKLEKKQPIEVLDPKTGLTTKLFSGRSRVTDWWRD